MYVCMYVKLYVCTGVGVHTFIQTGTTTRLNWRTTRHNGQIYGTNFGVVLGLTLVHECMNVPGTCTNRNCT